MNTDTTLYYTATSLMYFSSNYVTECPTCHQWVSMVGRWFDQQEVAPAAPWDHPLECEPCLKVRYG